ncbi:hypothetical protein VB005_05566 [Metarhizium brunneum]
MDHQHQHLTNSPDHIAILKGIPSFSIIDQRSHPSHAEGAPVMRWIKRHPTNGIRKARANTGVPKIKARNLKPAR